MNVLVLGMGSNVSQGIVKALRQINDLPIHIVGACISPSSVGLYLCDEALISPLASDSNFIPWYIDVCNEKQIDITFTGVEENIDALVKNQQKIKSSCRTHFTYPNTDIWNIGLDKMKTCIWLRDHGIIYPEFALASDKSDISSLIEKKGFPLIAKPRCGKSSAGIIHAYSYQDLERVIGNDNYVVQERIGSSDKEYTIGCYFSKDGRLQSWIAMRRFLKNGSTSMAEIVDNKEIDDLVQNIGNNMHMTGPMNLQARFNDDGKPVCFEWNVRYSGATSMRNHFGFHDVEAAIREYVLNESDISHCFNPSKRGVALRYQEEMYLENYDFESLYLENGLCKK